MLFAAGQRTKAEQESLDILNKIDNGQLGYEGVSGRWASYFMAQIMSSRNKKEESRGYYKKVIEFTNQTGRFDSGYYIASAYRMAEHYAMSDQPDLAIPLIKKIRANLKRRNPTYKKARALEKQIRRNRRK